MSTRSYQQAIDHLNSLQSNAVVLAALRASGGRQSQFAIPEMIEYLGSIGYTPSDLNALNVIHITGTKGKGSTSAFTESILRHSLPDKKIGLYTSPHLVAVRERIRIDGAPISEDLFARYFFEVWDKLVSTKDARLHTTPPMPGYFRFMTLLAFHVFLSLKVDATLLEVGVGGTYDSTNIVPKPSITGVTALGIDHVTVLGKTIPEIAWHKGGIFKAGIPALTVEQPPEGMRILEERAKELKASELSICSPISRDANLQLGIAGAHQWQNASLAVALARSFMKSRNWLPDESDLPYSFVTGLQETRWPGRCQTAGDPRRDGITWYLDGAHTVESLECCLDWFASPGIGLQTDNSRSLRILMFNCTSGRSESIFLDVVYSKISEKLKSFGSLENTDYFFDHVMFSTNVTFADGKFKGDLTKVAIPEQELKELKTQQSLSSAWSSIVPAYPTSHIHVLPSVEHAIHEIEKIRAGTTASVKVLVTGSLHLVGGVVEAARLSDVVF